MYIKVAKMYPCFPYETMIGSHRVNVMQLFILTVILILGANGYCFGEKSSHNERYLTVSIKHQPTEKAIRQLSRLSGYRIEIDKEYSKIPISLEMQGVDLNRALIEVLRALKIDNHAILMDEDNRTAAVIIFPSIDDTQTTIASPTGDKHDSDMARYTHLEKIKQDYFNRSLSPHDFVSPPSDDGKPGMTRQELETLKENYRNRKNQMTSDAIVSPPSGDGKPGMTLAELEALKDRKEPMRKDTIVSPPSGDGKPGMTLAELEALKREYQLSKK